jgi:hypothetical protein
MKALVIIVLVVAAIAGLLLTLRSSRTGMPSAEVMERAQRRAREQAAAEKKDE